MELAIVEELENSGQQILDIDNFLRVTVNQFYGIEIEEFPAQIAQTALWLMDHRMNRLVSSRLGRYLSAYLLLHQLRLYRGTL